MEKYIPPPRIRVTQVLPEQSDSSIAKQSFYKPPSRISSYSSQKSNNSIPPTPDYLSAQDFPSLGSSQVSTPKLTRTVGWSQMAKDWANKDEQEQARMVVEEETRIKNDKKWVEGMKFPSKLLTPSFIKIKPKVSFDNYQDDLNDGECVQPSNPLGITKDDWQ